MKKILMKVRKRLDIMFSIAVLVMIAVMGGFDVLGQFMNMPSLNGIAYATFTAPDISIANYELVATAIFTGLAGLWIFRKITKFLNKS